MVHNALDVTLLLQVSDRHTGKTAVDFQPLNEDGLADEAEGGDLLDDTVEGRLIERDGMDSFVLDLSLRPLLLLRRLSSAR